MRQMANNYPCFAIQADNAIRSADALKIKFEAEAETDLAPELPVTVTIPEARGLGPRPRDKGSVPICEDLA